MARNGDGLYQRANWYFKHRDSDGQFREHSTGESRQGDARKAKHDFIEKHRLGLLPTEMAEFTLDQALRERLAYLAPTGSSSSQAQHGSSVRHLLAALGGSRRLKTITARDLQQYQLTRSATLIRGRKTSAKTINNELLLLRSVLKQAQLWKGLEEDYKPLKVQKKGPGQALTVAQGEHLIRTAKQRDEWFVAMRATVIAYSTGCRSYEIKSLQLEDLYLDRNALRFGFSGKRRKATPDHGKWHSMRSLFGPSGPSFWARMLGASEQDHYLFPFNCSKHRKHGDPMKERTGYDPSHHRELLDLGMGNFKESSRIVKVPFSRPEAYVHHARHRGGASPYM